MKSLFVNLDFELAKDLVLILPDYGFSRIVEIDTREGDKISDLHIYDYIIVEPCQRFDINETLLNEIMERKRKNAQVIIFTVLDNCGLTADSVFRALGIEKIGRVPIRSWEEIKNILFG